jgi:hypothetical protein
MPIMATSASGYIDGGFWLLPHHAMYYAGRNVDELLIKKQ